MLIVLRGNSGSGKSTTAHMLRTTAIKRGAVHKIAVIEQDYLRRNILHEKESEGTDNLDLIRQTVTFAIDRGYHVILEGILVAFRYKNLIERLQIIEPETYVYYFDVSFDETLKRHRLKPNAHEFGEVEMKRWYKPLDILGFKQEKVLPQSLQQMEIVDIILNDTKIGT